MTIEVLFPKLCNLYGDIKNMDYLRLCLPEAAFVETQITDERPRFADGDVDMVFLGSMSEASQKRVVRWLEPYKARIEEMIDSGTVFLATGNAFEVFTDSIENLTTKETFPGLGLFHLTTKVDLFDRYNGKNIGPVDGIRVAGFRSQFSQVYGDNSDGYFMACEKGAGINRKSTLEGVRRKNFFGTHLLGPLLILNPLFTEHLMGLMGVQEPKAALREETIAAYEQRLEEFSNPKVTFIDSH